MKIRPETERLQGDFTLQLHAQEQLVAAHRDWQNRPEIKAFFAQLAQYGAGTALDQCELLQATMSDADQAIALVAPLIDVLAGSLLIQPLGQVPLRHNATDQGATLMLAEKGRAQLLLTERSPARVSLSTVAFNPVERADCVLAGRASAQIVEQGEDGAIPICTPLTLEKGATFSSPGGGQRRSLAIEAVDQSLVTLRLVRHPLPGQSAPAIEVSLDEGTTLRQAAGTVAESRQEMALALLGAMGRVDAVPVAAEMSRCGSNNLRWQAVRQCLVLDTAKGFAALSAMADDAADPLSQQAQSVRDQLVARHPVLGMLRAHRKQNKGAQPCHV